MTAAALIAFLVLTASLPPALALRRRRAEPAPRLTLARDAALLFVLIVLCDSSGIRLPWLAPNDPFGIGAVVWGSVCGAALAGADAFALRRWAARRTGLPSVPLPRTGHTAIASAAVRHAPLCVIAGAWEEACFRGVPFAFGNAHGPLVLGAVLIVSTLAFGLQHAYGGSSLVRASTVYGMVFTAVVIASGSVLAAALAHAIANLHVLAVVRPTLANVRGVFAYAEA